MDAMSTPLPDATTLEERKSRARVWFETLRDEICAALEALEGALPARRRSPNARRAALRARRGSAPITPESPAAAA